MQSQEAKKPMCECVCLYLPSCFVLAICAKRISIYRNAAASFLFRKRASIFVAHASCDYSDPFGMRNAAATEEKEKRWREDNEIARALLHVIYSCVWFFVLSFLFVFSYANCATTTATAYLLTAAHLFSFTSSCVHHLVAFQWRVDVCKILSNISHQCITRG